MILQDKYKKEVIKAMKDKFRYKNNLSVPKLEKISINIGLGQNYKDAKFLDVMEGVITRIAGQKPVRNRAKKSISNFKIREGNIIGMSVTLRGKRMYDFFYKLISVTLPRVRDFQGIDSKAVDKQGNLSVGFKEYLAFPEIRSDEVELLHGLEVTIVTSSNTKEEGYEFLKLMGIPFKALTK